MIQDSDPGPRPRAGGGADPISYPPLRPPGPSDVFWGEISPSEHLVQIYGSDAAYLDALEGFVAGGFRAGDGVIVIATPNHREALDTRLSARGFDLETLVVEDRYVVLDAEETIDRFTPNRQPDREGWPDEDLFREIVTDLIRRATGGGGDQGGARRRVRAFGEMVAIIWGRGHCGATVRLEHLWHQLCRSEAFSLFCAYPHAGFTQDAAASISAICSAHSMVVPG